jgi:two-component system cell cycle response regulator
MEQSGLVIIVDDEKSMLEMLRHSLGEEGIDCEAYSNGADALARIQSSDADMLITDIAMEGMRGLELTREAKRVRPDLNVIVMTGFVNDFSYDLAIEAGAADFIKKPFTTQELLMRIKHVKMQEKLRTISITDELTGLLNRRGFFALAQQQLKLFSRSKGRMALLFADVDRFKAINDSWGHQKGDEALLGLAGIFRDTFRESDIVARMSGDEFAILLIDISEKGLSLIHSRLRQNIDAFNAQSRGLYTLSISIGMVKYDRERHVTIDDLLRDADELMYREKQRKRGLEAQ